MKALLTKPYFSIALLFATLFIGTVAIQRGFAWTNPPSAPPFGTPLVITSGSNIGIGTSPSYKLDVNGTARVSSDLIIGGDLAFGVSDTRTQIRDDAGAQGGKSGFYETSAPVNYPSGASGWWHLLDVRHSNTGNNYAMQFAGSFFDQNLWFRKTNNSGSTAWQRVLTTADAVGGIGGSGTANYIPKFTAGTALGNSSIYDNGNVGIGVTSPGAKLEIAGQIKITGGTPGAGKVLTSDAAGLASWQAPGAMTCSCGACWATRAGACQSTELCTPAGWVVSSYPFAGCTP